MTKFNFSWTWKDILKLVLFLFFFWLCTSFIIGVIFRLLNTFLNFNLSIPKFSHISYISTPFIILLWHKLIIKDDIRKLGFLKSELRFSYLYAIIFAIVTFLLISTIALKNFAAITNYNYTKSFFLNLPLVYISNFNAASFVVVAPLAEELLFRSIIFRLLLKKFSIINSIIISSVLFAVAHIYTGLGAELYTTILVSLVFGIFSATLFYRSKSIYPSICSHVVLNTLVFTSKMITILTEQGIALP